jgi:hypothetical protein
MIDESEYQPPKQEQRKPKPKADPETLAYLERLPWQPFTEEW